MGFNETEWVARSSTEAKDRVVANATSETT